MDNTMATDKEDQAVTSAMEKTTSSQLESGNGGVIIDEETNKKLLRRVDLRVMPVVSQ